MAVFVPDKDFADEYPRSDDAKKMLEPLAEEAAEAAYNLAPVKTGNYRDSIEGVVAVDDDGGWVGRVLADDFKAGWIEFGTGPPYPTKAHRTLALGVESVVGKVGT